MNRKSLELLLNDEKLKELSKELNEFNIFKVLGIVNMEIKHSNILAWLLNPNESHELGGFFLKEFLHKIKNDNGFKINNLDKVIVKREWDNIDVLVEIRSSEGNFVCVIENKIWSIEHDNQLENYKGKIENYYKDGWEKCYRYLTPNNNIEEDKGDWKKIEYLQIEEIISKSIEKLKLKQNKKIIYLLEDYQIILKRYIIMKDDKLEVLTKELWNNHKDALVYLIENSLNVFDYFLKELYEKLKKNMCFYSNKSRLNFQTVIQKNKSTKEVFLSYYIRSNNENSEKIQIQLYLSGDNSNKKKELLNYLIGKCKGIKQHNKLSSENKIYSFSLIASNNKIVKCIPKSKQDEFEDNYKSFIKEIKEIDNALEKFQF